MWLGVSVEDQGTADVRIPLLLKTSAAKRFVSYEPALGMVDFNGWRNVADTVSAECDHHMHGACTYEDCACECHEPFDDGLSDGDDFYEDDDEDFDQLEFDCGWDGHGCSMAGSEDCDFECPFRDAMIASLNRKAAAE